MSNKLIDNKRRAHAEKILERNSEKSAPKAKQQVKATKVRSPLSDSDQALREQYKIIREDFIKLREDLAKGYVLAKNWMGQKSEAIRAR